MTPEECHEETDNNNNFLPFSFLRGDAQWVTVTNVNIMKRN